MLGYPDRATLLGVTVQDLFVNPEDRPRWQAIAENEDVVRDYEAQIRRYDGTSIWVDADVGVIRNARGRPMYYYGAVEDISVQKQAKEALRQSCEELETRIQERTRELGRANEALRTEINQRKTAQETLRHERNFISAILDTAGALVVVLDPQGQIVRFNRACEQMTGYSFHEVRGRRVWDLFVPPEEREPVQVAFAEVRGGQLHSEYEGHWVMRDGSRRLLAWTQTALLKLDGSVDYVIGTAVDITRRKEAEETLRRAHDELEKRVRERTRQLAESVEATREQARFLEAFFTGTITPIAFLDRAFGFIRVNEAYARAFQRRASKFPGRNLFESFPTDLNEPFRNTLESKIPFQTPAHPFALPRHPEHGVTYWDVALVPILNERRDVDFLVLALNNVTAIKRAEGEQAQLQEQLHEAQQLDLVARMATGLAHDFSNLLTGISGYMNLADDAVRFARGITESLLALAGQGQPEKAPVDLRTLVDNSTRLMHHTLPGSIQLETNVCETPAWVHGNAVELEQVLLNLAINARDSMPTGGRLQISLSQQATEEGPGIACLAVEDTGTGIAPEIMPHLFEPFFTTKPRGQGKGLGLPLAETIIRNHGGRIEVHSQPDEGSRFTVVLPCIPSPGPVVETETKQLPAAVEPRRTPCIVMLAETDRHVRGVISLALQSIGCEVMQIHKGEAIIQSLQEDGGAVSLLILDRELPECSGLECLRQLRASHVKTPAILMIRRDEPDLEAQIGDETIVLRKPFRLSEMERAVRRLLGEQRGVTGQ